MEKLFSEFKPVSANDWKLQIEKDLKGNTFDSLLKTNRNGVTIKPFYTKEDLPGETGPVFQNPDWEICAKIKVDNEKIANTQALDGLQNGVSGICFVIDRHCDFEVLLKDISIEHIYLQFIVKENIAAFVTGFKNYLGTKKLTSEQLNCTICY